MLRVLRLCSVFEPRDLTPAWVAYDPIGPAWVVATQDGARSSAGFQMISQRWPSGSWKYPE